MLLATLSVLALSFPLFACGGVVASEKMFGCDSDLHPNQYVSFEANRAEYITFLPMSDDLNSVRLFVLQTNEKVVDLQPYEEGDPFGYTISIIRHDDAITIDRMDLPLPEDFSAPASEANLRYDPTQGIRSFISQGRQFELIACSGIFSEQFRENYWQS